ncbi:phosphatidate cytidylyltransferase [Tolypothrix sp. PCC 7601]|nr:phosphatidate cytidylyltransferase [Tolypothrix sp. PCC 7601]
MFSVCYFSLILLISLISLIPSPQSLFPKNLPTYSVMNEFVVVVIFSATKGLYRKWIF